MRTSVGPGFGARALLASAALWCGACPSNGGDTSRIVRADAGTTDAGGAPDASAAETDAGFALRTLNLSPTVGEGESARYRVRGRLVPSSKGTAESARYVLRGGLTPISR